MVKQLRRGPAGSRSVVGLLPDNTWAMVPEWMTSREACAHCQLTEFPEVSLSALLDVATALDALPIVSRSSTIAPKRPQWRRLARMEPRRASANSRARQLELAWEGRIGWGELPVEIRLQLREELARLLLRLAVGGEVNGDDGEY